MAFLELRDVKKSFGSTNVLRGINLDVELHQVVCLIGASGSGKSTLLRCINQLETIDEGEIRLADDRVSGSGIDVDALRREVGIVFQSFNLFPHMTVLQNVMLAPVKVLGLTTNLAERLLDNNASGYGVGIDRCRCPDCDGELNRISRRRAAARRIPGLR